MIEWLTQNLFEIIGMTLIPLITWFVTKRHFQKRDLKDRDVNIELNQLEILSKNLDLYQRMLDDVETKYEERAFKSDAEKEELEKTIEELKIKIEALEKKILKLILEIKDLKIRLTKYEKNSNS